MSQRHDDLLRPIFGAEEEVEGDKGIEDPNGAAELEPGENDESKQDDDKQDGDKTYSATEYAALKRREQAADRAKSTAEKKLKEIEDAKKSELELEKERAAELQRDLEKEREGRNALRIENAFLASNKHQWHNPARALQIADLSGVEIDEAGKVTGLEEALDALAKSDPYLLKTTSSGGGQATGQPVGSGSRDTSNKSDRKLQEQKFPALRGR